MKKILLFTLILAAKHSIGQNIKINSTRDTTLIIAKEYCTNNATTCWYGDNPHVNRMLIYNGQSFWKNYFSTIFYFTGLDLRHYQETHNMGYDYLEKIETFLNSDMKNDSNQIIVVNKRKNSSNEIKTDTIQFKLYKIKFKYVFIKKSKEFVPNFFDSKIPASYIEYPSNIYYITRIDSIVPYNSLKQKKIVIKSKQI